MREKIIHFEIYISDTGHLQRFCIVLCISTQQRMCSGSPSDHWCSGHTPASPALSGPCCRVPAVGPRLWQPGAGRAGRSVSDSWTEHPCWCWHGCPMCSGNALALPAAPTHHRRSQEDPLWPPGMEQQVWTKSYEVHHEQCFYMSGVTCMEVSC